MEASLVPPDEAASAPDEAAETIGLTLLYVGGRQARIGHLRAVAERAGATFLALS